MPRKTGQVVKDEKASGGQAVLAEPGKENSGFMAYGPYRYLPSGKYKTDFRVRVGNKSVIDPELPACEVEITTDNGQKILNSKQLFPGKSKNVAEYETITFEYTLDKPKTLEFRVKTKGIVPVWYYYSYTRFYDQKDPLLSYEIEDMWHAGRTREDVGASGITALYLVPSKDPHDIVVSGPFRLYPPGRYRVSFYIRMDKDDGNRDLDMVELMVASGYRMQIIGKKTVRSTMLSKNDYKAVSIDFTLNHSAGLEFLVRFLGEQEVWVDRVEVDRIN